VDNVLTIVGSSARAAAGSAVRASFAVRAGDLFADADLCRVADATRVADYPAGLAAVVGGRQSGPWMYTGALENHPLLVDRLADLRRLWGNGAAVLRRVRHPRHVAEALATAGLCSPAVRFDPREVPRDGSWLVKPRRSAGGARIDFWTDAPTAAESRGCYFQQYVEGMPCSAVYVAANGRALLLGVTRQLIGQPWTGAAGFRYCGSIGPARLARATIATFAQIGHVLASTFDLVGLFGVDAIVNAAGVWPVEVNPRYTASVEILERAGGIAAIEAHRAACECNRLSEIVPAASGMVSGKAILFATSRLTISPAWADRARTMLDERRPLVADIPNSGDTIEPGWPIVTVFANASDETAVVETLRRTSDSVLATICSRGL
jgi:uncharacterized protein